VIRDSRETGPLREVGSQGGDDVKIKCRSNWAHSRRGKGSWGTRQVPLKDNKQSGQEHRYKCRLKGGKEAGHKRTRKKKNAHKKIPTVEKRKGFKVRESKSKTVS